MELLKKRKALDPIRRFVDFQTLLTLLGAEETAVQHSVLGVVVDY